MKKILFAWELRSGLGHIVPVRVEPDAVVFDHSPTALLAAKARTFRKTLLGSGFICPPPAEAVTMLL